MLRVFTVITVIILSILDTPSVFEDIAIWVMPQQDEESIYLLASTLELTSIFSKVILIVYVVIEKRLNIWIFCLLCALVVLNGLSGVVAVTLAVIVRVGKYMISKREHLKPSNT